MERQLHPITPSTHDVDVDIDILKLFVSALLVGCLPPSCMAADSERRRWRVLAREARLDTRGWRWEQLARLPHRWRTAAASPHLTCRCKNDEDSYNTVIPPACQPAWSHTLRDKELSSNARL